MENIERYIQAVLSFLPRERRMDVERELRAQIHDLMQKYSMDESESSKADKVLLELGDPEILAEKYMDKKRYLVGPNYYNKYILVLKIVAGAVFLGLTIATGLESAFSPEKNFVTIISNYISSVISGLAQGFVWVTVIFAIMERKGVDLSKESNSKKPWTLKNLPKSAAQKSRIPVSEPIVGIIFTTIFFLIIFFAPDVCAVFIPQKTGEAARIPFFDVDVLMQYSTFILLIYLASVAKEAVKFIYRRWTLHSSIIYCLLNILCMVLIILVFFNPLVWNPNFSRDLADYLNIQGGLIADNELLLRQVTNGILVLFLAGNIFDMAASLYKAVKYNFTASI